MSQDLIQNDWGSKIDALLARMTLEEKMGQMTQSGISIVGTFGVSFEELLDMMFDGRISHEAFQQAMSNCQQDYHEEEIRTGKLGSMNGVLGQPGISPGRQLCGGAGSLDGVCRRQQ